MADRKTLSVSLESDKIFIQALGILAKRRGVTIGKLMRQAADATFGNELEPIVSFFANDGKTKHQSDGCISSGPGAA